MTKLTKFATGPISKAGGLGLALTGKQKSSLGSYFAKVLELDISGNNIGLEGAQAGLTMKTSNTGCTLQTYQMDPNGLKAI